MARTDIRPPAEEVTDDALVTIPDANLRAAITAALGKTQRCVYYRG